MPEFYREMYNVSRYSLIRNLKDGAVWSSMEYSKDRQRNINAGEAVQECLETPAVFNYWYIIAVLGARPMWAPRKVEKKSEAFQNI